MKTLCLFLLSLMLLCGAFGEVIPFDTKIDFNQQVVESDGVWLVRFCSSSCTSADDDVLAKLSDLVKGIWSVATVSSTNEIADTYKIQKSPTYYIFSADKSKPLQYKGKTDPESLVQVMMDETIQMFQTRIGGKPSGTNGSSGGSSGGGSSNGKKKGASVVVEATEANYDEVVLNNPHVVLVAFTAPWCGYCKKLEPEWSNAARRLAGEDVTLVNVDATTNEKLAQRYGVKGFPTIKVFGGGNNKSHSDAKDYPGQREAGPIVEFALALAEETGVVKEIDELISQAILEDTCAGHNKICVLAALPHILDSGADGRNKYRSVMAKVRKQFRGGAFSFLWFQGGDAQLEFEKTLELTFGYPAVVALSLDRQAYSVLRGSFSEKSLAAFLNGVVTGRQPTIKMSSGLPAIITAEPWDGKDGQVVEEEMSLDDIMGWDDDEDDKKEEL